MDLILKVDSHASLAASYKSTLDPDKTQEIPVIVALELC